MWNFFLISGFAMLLFVLAIEKDLFSPNAILCEAYALSIVCALYMKETWNFSIHQDTVFVILAGNLWFVAVGLCTSLFYKRRHINRVDESEKVRIPYSSNGLLMLNIVCIIIVALYVFFFFQMVGGFSFSSFSMQMAYYRYNIDELEGIPTIISQSVKLVRAAAYIALYIYLNNSLIDKRRRREMRLLFPVICYFPLVILSGGRFDIIIFLIYALVLWILLQRYNRGRKNINFMSVFKILLAFLAVLLIFSNTRSLVGRTNTLDALSYISSYFGGSLQCFDVYLLRNGTLVQSDYFGQELFAGLHKLLVQFRIIEEVGGKSDLANFVTANSVVVGNVYTAYRKIIHDFGVGGVFLFQGLHSFLMNKWYLKAACSPPRRFGFSFFAYSILAFTLYLHPFSEFLFSTVLSWNYLLFFVFLYLVKKFLVNTRIIISRRPK